MKGVFANYGQPSFDCEQCDSAVVVAAMCALDLFQVSLPTVPSSTPVSASKHLSQVDSSLEHVEPLNPKP